MRQEPTMPLGMTVAVCLFASGLLGLFCLFMFVTPIPARGERIEPPSHQQLCERQGLKPVWTSRLNFCVDDHGQMFLPKKS